MKSFHLATEFAGALLLATSAAIAEESAMFTSFHAPPGATEYAFEFGALPDLTGDGVGEFWVYSNQRSYVYDGASLKQHYTLQSPCNGGVGRIEPADDMTGDGISELMGQAPCVMGGQVSFYNGASGQPLFTIPSPSPVFLGRFGETKRVVPDMTGDSHPDWLIHQPEFDSTAGRIYLFDSQTRKVARTYRNADPGFTFHLRVMEVIPDVDGDGKPDLLLAAHNASVKAGTETVTDAGRVVVRSLESGKVLYELIDPEAHTLGGFGLMVASIGDINRDGIADIAVGTHFKENAAGAIYFYSGSDGRWLRTLRSPGGIFSQGRFARGIQILPDLNGDSVPEMWVQEDGVSMTYVFDGATSALLKAVPAPHSLSSFYIAAVRQQAASGMRGYLFGRSGTGVSFLPFTPLPKPPRMKPLGASATGFRVQVTGDAGSKVEIQSSGDFERWDVLGSATLGDQAAELEDSTDASHALRFYRAVLKP